jgi:NAD(P)-dependent dehydrogenase (short-subunit alcohol dehydrogenase family)
MHTAMIERMAEKYADGDYQGFVQKRHNQVPIGHMGTAEDVAQAALFLASDEARYITGTEIIVDGGVTATIPD